MHLIVGLGNPGRQYDGTRHNIGFEVIDLLATRWKLPGPRDSHGAHVVRGAVEKHDVMLVKPQTFMNLSGDAVGALVRFYKADPREVIVVHDELDFSPGEVRLKAGGGHGGHNGLRSLAAHIGSDFARVRIGIGKPPPQGIRGADYVLGKFSKAERALMDDAAIVAMDAVESILSTGIAAAMNRFNQRS